MFEGRVRNKKSGLIVLLVILVVVILGLGVVIYFVAMRNSRAETEITEEFGDDIAVCIIDYNSDGCELVEDRLVNITNFGDEDERVQANIFLAEMTSDSDIGSAIMILDGMLAEDISDQNRYNILRSRLGIYKNIDDKDGCMETMRLLIELPDSMELELESWPYAKQVLIEQLNEMANSL